MTMQMVMMKHIIQINKDCKTISNRSKIIINIKKKNKKYLKDIRIFNNKIKIQDIYKKIKKIKKIIKLIII